MHLVKCWTDMGNTLKRYGTAYTLIVTGRLHDEHRKEHDLPLVR